MPKSFSVHSRLVVYFSLAAVFLLTTVIALLYWGVTSEAALHVPWSSFITHERRVFCAVFIAAALLTLLMAFFVTGRGLLGLDQLTQTVREISTSSLDTRLHVHTFPKELLGLAGAFNQMLARMEDSFVRLKKFSDDMAHELRTPLTRLQLQSEVLLSGKLDNTESMEILSSNLEVIQQMSAMIDSMLFLARAENSEVKINKEKLNVITEARKITEYFEVVADEKQVKFSIEGEASITANSLMFERLLNNLVTNALRHTSVGGSVTVKAVTEPEGDVIVYVKDTGSGIDAIHLPKLFDRFYRVDQARTTTSAHQGTGLGLAIAKSIMELHLGKISIDSAQGQGTVVKLEFPKAHKVVN